MCGLESAITHTSEPYLVVEGTTVEAKQWMEKEGQMEVTWLLTNRKHGGKTKSISILKATLKKKWWGGGNKKDDC